MFKKTNYSNKFSVAPMLKYTDQHCRFFYRQLTKKTLLYTEMITTQEMLYKKKFIKYTNFNQHPIAIQIAGSEINKLVECAKIAYLNGFNEFNLNCGCPSKKAQMGNFGVCLMKNPVLIFNIVKSIYNSVPIPISIKIRLGTKKKEKYQFLYNFIKITSKNKYCTRFIIHARIANLNIYKPKKNNNIPPLNYNYVYKIKKDFPYLKIILNGGIHTLEEANKHLKKLDGIMMGRSIYKNPLMLYNVDKKIFLEKKIIKKNFFLTKMQEYIILQTSYNVPAIYIFRHILNIFYKKPNSKIWKKYFLNLLKNKTDNIFILFQLSKHINIK